jgi:hypothetical protein
MYLAIGVYISSRLATRENTQYTRHFQLPFVCLISDFRGNVNQISPFWDLTQRLLIVTDNFETTFRFCL